MSDAKVDIDTIPAAARIIFGQSYDPTVAVNQIGDDDCGIIRLGSGVLVLTTDLMNHRPALMTLDLQDKFYNYGYLIAVANLSDLYGTGAVPLAMLVGLLLPEGMKQEHAERVLRGIQACCRRHSVHVVGGDTKRADRLQGYGVAIGWADSVDHLFTRCGVTPGQDLYLSGAVGDFNAAVYVLSCGLCPEEWRGQARRVITRPNLRRRLSLAISRGRLATGGIDISDGLGLDLWRLAQASRVKLAIDARAIPIGNFACMVAERFQIDPLAFVFATGGDWQFVFSSDRGNEKICQRLGATLIGVAQEGEGCSLSQGDVSAPLPSFGHSDNRGLDFSDEVSFGVKYFSQSQG